MGGLLEARLLERLPDGTWSRRKPYNQTMQWAVRSQSVEGRKVKSLKTNGTGTVKKFHKETGVIVVTRDKKYITGGTSTMPVPKIWVGFAKNWKILPDD